MKTEEEEAPWGDSSGSGSEVSVEGKADLQAVAHTDPHRHSLALQKSRAPSGRWLSGAAATGHPQAKRQTQTPTTHLLQNPAQTDLRHKRGT